MSTPLSQVRTRAPRRSEEAVERARLTVVPRRTAKAPRVPFVSLVTLLLVGGIVGLLLFNTSMQQGSFVASSLEERAAVLAGKEETLRIQLHRLREPQHVAAEAKKLGMVPAGNPAFLRLSDGKVLGKPALAQPTDAVRIVPLPPVKPASLQARLVILDVPRAGRDAETRQTRQARQSRRAAGRRQDGRQPRRDTTRGSDAASPDRATERRTKRQERSEDGRGRTP